MQNGRRGESVQRAIFEEDFVMRYLMQNQEKEEDECTDDDEWRKLLDFTIDRIASNDNTLVALQPGWLGETQGHDFDWSDADFQNLGLALVGNTHLRILSICVPSGHCLGWEPTIETDRLLQGIARSQLRTLNLVRVCCQVQQRLLQGASLSNLRDLLMTDMVSLQTINVAALLKDPPPSPVPSTKQHLVVQCRLEHLHLARCDMTDLDMLDLSLGIASNRSLQTLKLPDNGITSVGIIYFCQHWRDDSPLQELVLTDNHIGSTGAQCLLRATTHHRAFHYLALEGNKSIGYDGLAFIGETLPHSHIHHLNISMCVDHKVRTTAEEKLVACRTLANGLRDNSSLRTLFVGNDHIISARGAQLLMQAVAAHPTMQTLSFANDKYMGFRGIKLMADEIPHLHRLKSLVLGVCPPWPKPQTKLARQAACALLQGVQNNFSLTHLSFDGLPRQWINPIQFFISGNKTCRPFFSDELPAIWPHILVRFDRRRCVSHLYFALREQPWLVNQTR